MILKLPIKFLWSFIIGFKVALCSLFGESNVLSAPNSLYATGHPKAYVINISIILAQRIGTSDKPSLEKPFFH